MEARPHSSDGADDLHVTSATPWSVSVAWDVSQDNVGVAATRSTAEPRSTSGAVARSCRTPRTRSPISSVVRPPRSWSPRSTAPGTAPSERWRPSRPPPAPTRCPRRGRRASSRWPPCRRCRPRLEPLGRQRRRRRLRRLPQPATGREPERSHGPARAGLPAARATTTPSTPSTRPATAPRSRRRTCRRAPVPPRRATASARTTQAPSTPSGLAASSITQSALTSELEPLHRQRPGHRLRPVPRRNEGGLADLAGREPVGACLRDLLHLRGRGPRRRRQPLRARDAHDLDQRLLDDAASASAAPATDTHAPSTPSGLAASSITQSALTLSWNPSTDNVQVTGYDLYRDGTKVASPTSPGASQSGLACGTSYTFARRGPRRRRQPLRARACSRPRPAPARRLRLRLRLLRHRHAGALDAERPCSLVRHPNERFSVLEPLDRQRRGGGLPQLPQRSRVPVDDDAAAARRSQVSAAARPTRSRSTPSTRRATHPTARR